MAIDVIVRQSAVKAASKQELGNLYFQPSYFKGRLYYQLRDADSLILLKICNFFRLLFGLEQHIYGESVSSVLSPTPKEKNGNHLSSLATNKNVRHFADYVFLQKKDPLFRGKFKLARAVKKIKALSEGVSLASSQDLAPKLLVADYAQEVLTENHYMVCSSFEEAASEWLQSGQSLSFDNWLIDHPEHSELYRVRYLNESEREEYRVEIQDGKLVRKGNPYATQNESTAFSGKGTAIFVESLDGKLYMGSHKVGEFHHSSFLSGSAVLSAGEICTDSEGKILKISNKSGHYRPNVAQNIHILKTLEENGVDLSEVCFECLLNKGVTCVYASAKNYLESKGKAVPSGIKLVGSFIKIEFSDEKIILREVVRGLNRDVYAEHFSCLSVLKELNIDLSKVILVTAKESSISCLKYFSFLKKVTMSATPYKKPYDEAAWEASGIKARKNWKKGFEKARKLVGGGRLGLDVVGMNSTYFLEALLPNHPYGRDTFFKLNQPWKSSQTNLSLEDFSISSDVIRQDFDSISETTYLTEEGRKQFLVEIRDGLMYQQEKLLNSEEDLCFVLGPDDELYAAPHRRGTRGVNSAFNHSSFFSGKPIKMGGMFPKNSVKEGEIVGTITNKTGHYGNSPKLLLKDLENCSGDTGGFGMSPRKFLRLESFLTRKGINSENLKIMDVESPKKESTFSLKHFCAKAKEIEAEPYFQNCDFQSARRTLNTLSSIGAFSICPGINTDYILLIKRGYNLFEGCYLDVVPEGFVIQGKEGSRTYPSIEAVLKSLNMGFQPFAADSLNRI